MQRNSNDWWRSREPRSTGRGASRRSASGLSGASTAKMLDTLDATAAWPIDVYLIASPYYTRPSQRRLFAAFHRARRSRRAGRLLIYNIPYRHRGQYRPTTRCFSSPGIRNIVGMKDCCADRAQSIDFLARRPSGAFAC